MNIKFFSLVICILLGGIFLPGCKKKAADVHPELVGAWRTSSAEVVLIDIASSGLSKAVEVKGSSVRNYRGVARIEDNTLKIGLKKFKINMFPIANANSSYMELDGVIYVKD